jgi:hypothetical protein
MTYCWGTLTLTLNILLSFGTHVEPEVSHTNCIVITVEEICICEDVAVVCVNIGLISRYFPT